MAIETVEVIGTNLMAFTKNLGHRIHQRTEKAEVSCLPPAKIISSVQRG